MKQKITQKIDVKKLLQEVHKDLAPDDTILEIAQEVVDTINTALRLEHIAAECMMGGSTAKKTFLKDNHDIDLFVRFEHALHSRDISQILEAFLKKINITGMGPIERIHGSRDYFQCVQHLTYKKKVWNINYEIIPVLKIYQTAMHEAQNVTDFSPLHVQWVQQHTLKKPQLCDDIRLTKQFCKAQGVYGAESFINGFSGHIIDILIIYFGSFIELINAFARIDLSKPVIIDYEKHLTNPLKELNKSKITPLIVIDPIQKERNAAAAVNLEKLTQFCNACKAFLEHPSKKYFSIKPFNLKKDIATQHTVLKKAYPKKLLNTTIIDIIPLVGSKDIVGTKILKVYEHILYQCNAQEFKIMASAWHYDHEKRSAVIYLISDATPKSAYCVQEGPPLKNKTDVERFSVKHGVAHTFQKDGRIYAKVPRKYHTIIEVLHAIGTEVAITSRVQKITIRKTAV